MRRMLTLLILAAAANGQPQPIAVHEHETSGVEVALMEVKRGPGDVVTVTWEYRNKTKEPKQLTSTRTGWIDPYRLSVDTFLADPVNKQKYVLMTDDERRPIAARIGAPNQFIVLKAGAKIVNWAKYPAPPPEIKKISVIINGVTPFEDVPIQ